MTNTIVNAPRMLANANGTPKDQQVGRAEVLTSYGKALEKDGGGERT